jgi:hypothetical protein
MAEVNANFIASQMIFIDESSKDDRTIYRHYGRAPSGRRATIQANFVRGDRFSIVAALSLDGYEAMQVVPGSVDGEAFLDFVVNDVVSALHLCTFSTYAPLQMPRMNPYPRDKSIIVLDNCSIHKTNALQEILEGNRHRLLFLPPYSPDFNPIEESFSCGTSQCPYYGVSCSCKPSVKAWIRRHWLRVREAEYPEIILMDAAHAVTGQKARQWFAHSGYLV